MPILKISVTIADRPYRLNVESEEEEALFREAARLIEEQSKKYASSFAFRDKQDLLAMVALQYTTEALNHKQELHDTRAGFAQKLSSLDNMLKNN